MKHTEDHYDCGAYAAEPILQLPSEWITHYWSDVHLCDELCENPPTGFKKHHLEMKEMVGAILAFLDEFHPKVPVASREEGK